MKVFFFFFRKLVLVNLMLHLLVLSNVVGSTSPDSDLPSDKINLALRRTADHLLRQVGDSTTRIPAIVNMKERVWQLRLDQPFIYDSLPNMLKSSFELYDVHQRYHVAVRNCENNIIDLGFHQDDSGTNKDVPCSGRDMPEGCHYIEVTFLQNKIPEKPSKNYFWVLTTLLAGFILYWTSKSKRTFVKDASLQEEVDYLAFGNCKLDLLGQTLWCGEEKHTLTFREAKLLHLFASNINRLLERDFILSQVWADEGVMVGRSIDVFVSRLRKKIANDQTIGIVAVHGVGYRMELNEHN